MYQQELLGLARAADGAGSLPGPDGAATVDNPLCGDRVTVEVALTGEVIGALAHRVRGCLLCEAAAAALGRRAPGATPEALRAAEAWVTALLKGRPDADGQEAGGAAGAPEGDRSAAGSAPPWPELALFAPVAAVRSRHRCVLLPFEALERALADAETRTAATGRAGSDG